MTSSLENQRFGRSAKYNPAWMLENAFGANSVWLVEWLCEELQLEPGMRVLDLGCGRAKSSIFLAREFGVQVWATDLWVPASENGQRIHDAGLEGQVFPIHADARGLPFAGEFFDAILAVDCFPYFGSDELFLNYWVHFVKKRGQLGIAGAGMMREFEEGVPAHLRRFWTQDAWCLKTATGWRDLWQRTGLVDIQVADTLEDGWQHWLQWAQAMDGSDWYLRTLEQDRGQYLGYIRVVARREPDEPLEEYAWPDPLRHWPSKYEKRPLLRSAADESNDVSPD